MRSCFLLEYSSRTKCNEEKVLKIVNNFSAFRTKRAELKEDGKHSRDVQDVFAFHLVKKENVINQIAQHGLCTRPMSFNALGEYTTIHTSTPDPYADISVFYIQGQSPVVQMSCIHAYINDIL